MPVTTTIGRKSQYIDCRAEIGVGVSAGIAQRGTIGLALKYDVLVLGMSGTRRHVFKPVCEISMGLRERGIELSVMILSTGEGVPEDFPGTFAVKDTFMHLTPKELEQMKPAKVLIAHFGNVKRHVLYKARMLLRNIDRPCIIVCQTPIDFEDFAELGVRTLYVRPIEENMGTKGYVSGIVTDVARGVSCPKSKIDETAREVWISMPPSYTEPSLPLEAGRTARYIPTRTKGVIEDIQNDEQGWWAKLEGKDLWYHTSKLEYI